MRSIENELRPACEFDNYPLQVTRGSKELCALRGKLCDLSSALAPVPPPVASFNACDRPQKIKTKQRRSAVRVLLQVACCELQVAIGNAIALAALFHNCRFVLACLCLSMLVYACNCGFVTFRKLIHCARSSPPVPPPLPFTPVYPLILAAIRRSAAAVIAFKWFCVVVCAIPYCRRHFVCFVVSLALSLSVCPSVGQ